MSATGQLFLVGLGSAALGAALGRVWRGTRSAKNGTRLPPSEISRLKSDFLSTMSHELRTPLNSVIGFSNILLRGESGHGNNLSSRQIAYLERIRGNGEGLLGLITDMLDLAKLEAGKMRLETREVNLADLTRLTVEALAARARAKGVRLHLDVSAGPCAPLRADPQRLGQVLSHLIENGIKFTEEGGVTIRLRLGEDRAPSYLEVEDTGLGIPREMLKHIFKPFAQVDHGTSRKFEGSGLGLAIARAYLLRMGYSIEADSEVGLGTRFTIRFV